MKNKQAVRFSLGFLLLMISTVGIWMAAYRHGYQSGDRVWRYNDDYTLAYDVHDLVEPIPNRPLALGPDAPKLKPGMVDAEPLLKTLQAPFDQVPDEAPRLVFFPGNLSLIVSGSGRAHRLVAETLEELREQPKKWNMMVTGDANWIPEGTVVYEELP